MGLVVQAVQDPLLTLLTPSAPAAKATGVPAAFRALLAELLGAPGAETSAGRASKDGLPADNSLPGDLPAAGDTTKDDTKGAALIALLAQLQPGQIASLLAVMAPDKRTEAEPAVTSAGSAPLQGEPPAETIAGVTTGAAPADETDDLTATTIGQAPGGPGSAAPTPAGAETPAAQEGSTSPALSSEPEAPESTAPQAVNGPEKQAPSEATEPPANATTPPAPKEHSDNSGKTVLPPGMFRAAFKGRAERTDHRNRGSAAAGDDSIDQSAPPGDAPPVTQQAATSVVRSVGNANDQAATNSNGNGQVPGQPQPKASVEGVAHASDQSVLHRADEPQQASGAEAATPATRPQLPEAAQQVVRAVLERVEQGGGEARLHLRPENLGEVVIRVHTDGDHVRVEIHADRPEAAQLLREHAVNLSSMLGKQGLNLGDVWVGLGGQQAGGSQNGQQPQHAGGNRPGSSDFAALVGIGDSVATDRHNLLRAAYNPDGAHVYRV